MSIPKLPILADGASSESKSCGDSANIITAGDHVEPSLLAQKDFAGNALLVTLGCSKNLVDSEVMLGALKARGFRIINEPEEADLIIVNTCSFLQSAVEESIERILEFSEFRVAGRCKSLLVAGCLVERYRSDLEKELPEVDRFVSTDELLSVGDSEFTSEHAFDQARRPYFLYDEAMPRVRSTAGHTAYVKISEGCDRPCAFCIIPKIRGKFRSRSIESIVTESRDLLADGVRELNLVAQDLTAYGNDFAGSRGRSDALPSLLRELDSCSPVEDYWIRLFYAYPVGVTDELLTTILESQHVCRYLDLPLQHISNSVLKGMRRPLGEKGTRSLIEKMRAHAPDIALRTTFVVGFPGETEEDVCRLESFIREGHFAHVGVFAYSQEEEAASYVFDSQVAEEVREERRARLMSAQQDVVFEKNQSYIGTRHKVLVEGLHRDTDLLVSARTAWQGPEADGEIIINELTEEMAEAADDLVPDLIGGFIDVEVTEVAGYDLVAKVIE